MSSFGSVTFNVPSFIFPFESVFTIITELFCISVAFFKVILNSIPGNISPGTDLLSLVNTKSSIFAIFTIFNLNWNQSPSCFIETTSLSDVSFLMLAFHVLLAVLKVKSISIGPLSI